MLSMDKIADSLASMETPYYFYDMDLLKDTVELLQKEAGRYDYHVHYALKANSNRTILEFLQKMGLGADCVSGNEIKQAIDCGFPASSIAFAGVGKSDKEINIALDNDIFCFNCESLPELFVINELAKKKGKVARIALRINPNVNANTHKYITTGLKENKFGINRWDIEKHIEVIKELNRIELIGLHFHIGSQITDFSAFRGLCLRVNEVQEIFEQNHIHVSHVNVGGGLGIDYTKPEEKAIPDFQAFFKIFHDMLNLRPHQSVHFELGRSIVGQCGSLISTVLYVKEGVNTDFAIIDAGMTDLLRPALYQAVHNIENLSNPGGKKQRYDVVGPICESSDSFAKSMMLPYTSRGDIMAIRSCGAYGEVMSSRYNLRELPGSYYYKEMKSH